MPGNLNDSVFVDLYIGEKSSQMSGLNGVGGLQLTPGHLMGEIAEIRHRCLLVLKSRRNPEFVLNHGGALYRVTALESMRQTVFVLRQSTAKARDINDLGLGDAVIRPMLEKGLKGLVYICGEMAMGKTSTGASVFVERIKRFGGLGLCIEDPPELDLEEIYSNGQIIQVWADLEKGGYREQMRRGIRSGAAAIYLGEIRDGVTAAEACRAGINGHLIITTGHGGDPVEAIQRLHSFALQEANDAASLLADGLAIVVWQTLEDVTIGLKHVKRLRSQMLNVKISATAKIKIRESKFASLYQELEQQASSAGWQERKNGND